MAALSPLILKNDWQLKEFEAEYAKRVLMTIPSELQSSLSASKGELYEGYGNKFVDIRDNAVIIPSVHNNDSVNKTDNIILWLDPYLSDRLDECLASVESRMATLFAIKEKWTLQELDIQLKDFLEPE